MYVQVVPRACRNAGTDLVLGRWKESVGRRTLTVSTRQYVIV